MSEKSVVEKSKVSRRDPGGRISPIVTSRVRRYEPEVEMNAQRLWMNVEEFSMPVCGSRLWVMMLRWRRPWKMGRAVMRHFSNRDGKSYVL